MRFTTLGLLAAMPFVAATAALAFDNGPIGEVTTKWRPIGSNDKIIVQAFDDPEVPGVACHLSHAAKGSAIPGNFMVEDSSDASIACRQIGPISADLKALKSNEGSNVFTVRQNVFFKTLNVRRLVDVERKVLVYLTYSDRIIDGSPKNAISSVPIMPWR